MTTARTRLIALLGQPVSHSASPAMMTHAFHAMSLDAVYIACDVRPSRLDEAVHGLRALGALGANVTLPHKPHVARHCDVLDRFARAADAVNTVVFGERTTSGFNTDAPGAVNALRDAGCDLLGADVVVLGAGGAASAVCAGLADAGASRITVLTREASVERVHGWAVWHRAEGWRTELRVVPWSDRLQGEAAVSMADGVVQCTPLGMRGYAGDVREITAWLAGARAGAWAMDLVYNPRETPWLRAARERHLRTIDGLGMLAWQGALALAHWFNVPADPKTLRTFLDAAPVSG